MNDNKQLSVMQNSLIPSEHELQCFQVMARQSAASGFYKSIGGEPQIMSILLLARELNISPMLALSGGIWNINGKVEISSRMMNTLIRRAGHSLQVKESTDRNCIIIGKRADNGDTFEASFSIQDAEKAGLTRNQTWTKYPKDMLFARALSRLARQLFSDCIGTAYCEGEIRGELRESSYEVIDAKEETPQISEEELNELMITYKANFDVADHELAERYLTKYCDHYGVAKHDAIASYEPEKLQSDFAKWKAKQLATSV